MLVGSNSLLPVLFILHFRRQPLINWELSRSTSLYKVHQLCSEPKIASSACSQQSSWHWQEWSCILVCNILHRHVHCSRLVHPTLCSLWENYFYHEDSTTFFFFFLERKSIRVPVKSEGVKIPPRFKISFILTSVRIVFKP